MSFRVGSQVLFKGDPGVVRFVGETGFANGVWIGVELNGDNGKNDGSVNGVRYFQCPDKHGIFVRETMLEVMDEGAAELGKVRSGSRAASRITSRSSDIMPNDQDETTRLRSIIQKLQDKLLSMKSDIEKLRTSLHSVEVNNSELQEKVSKAEEDLEISAIDKETLEEQNELYKQEIASLTEQNSNILKELQALKDELNSGLQTRDPTLINESTDSLIKRNSLLEAALVKLRDHADSEHIKLTEQIHQLEDKIKPLSNIDSQYREAQSRLIEAEKIIDELRSQVETSIHSAEIIESLTDKNNELIEENHKLQSSLKELEDLRKIEEELEAFHTENEKQLQQEIGSLKTSLANQQQSVKVLEERNKELYERAQELQQLSQNKEEFNEIKAKSIPTINQQENHLDNLRLKLLEIEISYKEEEISYLENAVGSSDFLIHKKDSLLLKKYSKLFQCLALNIPKSSSDLFISILVAKLQYSLKSFSLFLLYVHSRYEYAISHTQLKLNELKRFTQKLIKIIEDEDYRDVPNFDVIQTDIMGQIQDQRSAFQQVIHLKYELELEDNSLDALLTIITLLNTREAKENYDFSDLELTQLYQYANQQKSKIMSHLGNVRSFQEQNKEISSKSPFYLTPQIIKFADTSVNSITKSDISPEEKSSLVQETNSLINLIEIHKDDEISWEVTNTESEWFLKQTGSNHVNSKEFQSLQEELESFKTEIQKKDKYIDEINLKVNVLTSRLSISKETESQLKKLKEEASYLKKDKDDLSERVQHLLSSNQQLSSDLRKARDNSLLNNSQFESLLEQKKYNEKAELISELHSLRNSLRILTKRHQTERNWLRVEIPKRNPFEKKEADELRLIGRDLRKAVKTINFYSLKN